MNATDVRGIECAQRLRVRVRMHVSRMCVCGVTQQPMHKQVRLKSKTRDRGGSTRKRNELKLLNKLECDARCVLCACFDCGVGDGGREGAHLCARFECAIVAYRLGDRMCLDRTRGSRTGC